MPRVRKRDGSLSEYDEGKVAHEILQAAQASGEGDPAFAAELAEVVTFFLEKHHGTGKGDTLVEPEQIADMIERVLLETAPPGVAKAYMLRRQRREDADEDITVHRAHSYGQKALFPEDVLTVEAETRAEAFHWDKHRIVDALVRESDIAPKAAAKIADRVEERLFSSGLKRVTTGLIRELIDVELFELGMTQHRDQQAVIGIPRYDLEAAILRGREADEAPPFRGPADLARFVHTTVLRRYTLVDVHSPEVGEAHVDGRLHLHGLGEPLRLHSLRVCPEGVKHGWPAANRTGQAEPPDPRKVSDRIAAPATEEQLLALLRRYAEELQELVTDRVTFTSFSLVLAPLVARQDADARRALLRRAFGALSGRVAARLRLEFPLEVPVDLRDAPVVGLGGTVEDGLRLGDLTPVVRELARDATMLLLEGKHQALLSPDIVIAIDNDAVAHAESIEVLELAADCASRHGAPRFRFLRPARMDAAQARGGGTDTLARSADAAVIAISLNLPQAAFRAGRSNHDAFAAECDRLLHLTHTAVTERWQLLVGGLSRLAHPLLAVGRDTSTPLHPATIDLRNGYARLAVVGLHEAMAYLADGRDPEEAAAGMFAGDAPPVGESTTRGGLRALSYLAFALREQEAQTPVSLRLADGREPGVATRFRRIDTRTRPDHLRKLRDRVTLPADAYTTGISLPGAADPMACITRESRFHTMLDRDAEIVVPARCPTHNPQTVVEALRHAIFRTTAHGIALPAMAVSCPACGDSKATPLAVPAVCPTCGYRAPEFGWLIGNRFVANPGVAADTDGETEPDDAATRSADHPPGDE